MTGSVRAFRGIEFAIRRASDIISGAVVDFAKHGVNRGNRNNLHVKFKFLGLYYIVTDAPGRGQVAGRSREWTVFRPTKRSYNYQNRVQRYKKKLIYASIGD